MHLNELNHRSPLRLFERSMHGGLGRGNLGLVAARAGVGKSGFLTSVAIDDLLRGQKVLHVTTSQTVERVRDFYDEIFSDLAHSSNLEETAVARRKLEGNRFIRSLGGQQVEAAGLAHTLDMLRDEVRFVPDLVVIDGYDFERAQTEDVAGLRDAARRANAELWMAIRTPNWNPEADWHEFPAPVARLADIAGVVVFLHPIADAIRIRLLKDHDNAQLADLALDLDPRTFLVKEA